MTLLIPEKIKKDSTTYYTITGVSVTVNSNTAKKTYTGDYEANINDPIKISGTLDGGESINYGSVILKLPVIRCADGKPTSKEIYFNATVVNGVLTANGSFPTGGHWCFDIKRINRSIDRAGNGWYLLHNNIDFLV